MDVRLPDGTVIQGVPDGTTKAQIAQKLQANGMDVPKEWLAAAPAAKPQSDTGRDIAGGILRGAGSIGATILAPVDWAARELNDGKPVNIGGYDIVGQDRRAGMDAALDTAGVDRNSLPFQGAKLLTEVGGTLGVGGAVANTLGRAPVIAAKAAPYLDAVRSAGMTAGGVTGKTGMALRMVGGGTTGAAAAGLVNPDDTGTGGVIGAALPPVMAGAGRVGSAIGKKVAEKVSSTVSPEVAALARRAKDLGIDIPADRLVDSKLLNAVAAGLNYTPFSGRAATEARMSEQLNRAASRLIGQDTPNMTQAIRKAGDALGAKFDSTLRSTGVAVDKQMLDDVARVFNTAERELGSDALKPIAAQIDDLMSKATTGTIDGQAAYNIKRTLDRLGRGNTPTAYHALELKGVLMDALNRSLGPDGAKAFATTRQQYGNMLALEKLARNGVEGELSVARLANMGNINNQPLQELADIAAQFVKAREGQHGAAQRAFVGMGVGTMGGPTALVGGAVAGRTANMLLNSNALRNAMVGLPNESRVANALMGPTAQEYLLRSAPVAVPAGYGR